MFITLILLCFSFSRSVGEGSNRHIEVSKEPFPEVSVTATEVVNKVESKAEKVVRTEKVVKPYAPPPAKSAHAVKSKAVPAVFAKESKTGCGRSSLLNLIPPPVTKPKEEVVVEIKMCNTTVEVEEVESSDDEEEDIFAPVPSTTKTSAAHSKPTYKSSSEAQSALSTDHNMRNVRVSSKISQQANDRLQSAYQTDSKAGKKGGSGSKAKSAPSAGAEEDDDDAILDAAILENQVRLGAVPCYYYVICWV